MAVLSSRGFYRFEATVFRIRINPIVHLGHCSTVHIQPRDHPKLMPHQNHPDRDVSDLVIDHTDHGTAVLRNPGAQNEWIESTSYADLTAWM